MICFYWLLTFQNLALNADLPLLGHTEFSLKENTQYLISIALFLTLFVFWRVRKEKEGGENHTQFE